MRKKLAALALAAANTLFPPSPSYAQDETVPTSPEAGDRLDPDINPVVAPEEIPLPNRLFINGSLIIKYGHNAPLTSDVSAIPVYKPTWGYFSGGIFTLGYQENENAPKLSLTGKLFSFNSIKEMNFLGFDSPEENLILAYAGVAMDHIPVFDHISLNAYALEQIFTPKGEQNVSRQSFGYAVQTQPLSIHFTDTSTAKFYLSSDARFGEEDTSVDPAYVRATLGIVTSPLTIELGAFAPLHDDLQVFAEARLDELESGTSGKAQLFITAANDDETDGNGPYHSRLRLIVSQSLVPKFLEASLLVTLREKDGPGFKLEAGEALIGLALTLPNGLNIGGKAGIITPVNDDAPLQGTVQASMGVNFDLL